MATTYHFDRWGVVTARVGPPSAPTGVAATPASGRATVSWNASAPNGSPISSYTLTASPGGATVSVGGGTTTTTFGGLTNGTAYTFTVRATNALGTSPASAPSNSVTPTEPPSTTTTTTEPPPTSTTTEPPTTTTTTTEPPSTTTTTTTEPPPTTTTTEPPPTTTTTEPPPDTSGDTRWGVDSAQEVTSSKLQDTIDTFGSPEIWGRYLGRFGLTPAEVSFAHDNGVALLVVDADYGSDTEGNDQTNDRLLGYENGQLSAKNAIENGQSLGLPAGVAIFADIEPNTDVDGSWLDGWHDGLNDDGTYEVGYYGNPLTGGFEDAFFDAGNRGAIWVK